MIAYVFLCKRHSFVTLLFNLTSRAGDSKLPHSGHWLSLSECTLCGDFTKIAYSESGYKTKFGFFLTWQVPLRHNIQTLILSCTWIIDRFFRKEIPWKLFWCLQRDSTPSERGHFRRGFTSPREEATQPPPAGFSPTGPSAANTLWLARWPPLPRPAQASRVTWPHGPS